jgi:PEP-CTERM motif
MRALILRVLATAVLTAAPLAASADTITLKFSIPIPAGNSNNSFPSSRIRQFDGSLGTLTDTTIALTDSMTWTPGSAVGGASLATLTVTLHSGSTALSQTFTGAPGKPQRIELDLHGDIAAIGQSAVLTTSEASIFGSLSRNFLEGTVTYGYIPFPSSIVDPPPIVGDTVPEPSTWAMMLIGFAGVAYFGWRAKLAERPSAV